MYGFRHKQDALDLHHLAENNRRQQPLQSAKTSMMMSDNTRIVRVHEGSYEVNQSDGRWIAGIASSEDYGAVSHNAFNADELLGVYQVDWGYAIQLLFNQAYPSSTELNPTYNQAKTKLGIKREFSSPDPSSGDTPITGETGGNLSHRSKMKIWNCSLLPIHNGQIIEVHKIGPRWMYTGEHNVFGTVNGGDILAGERGDVLLYTKTTDNTPTSTAFNFDGPMAFIPNEGNSLTIKAFNPWSDDIPEDAKCVVGVVNGIVTVLGWEC